MLPSRIVSRKLNSKMSEFQPHCFHITLPLQGLKQNGLLTHWVQLFPVLFAVTEEFSRSWKCHWGATFHIFFLTSIPYIKICILLQQPSYALLKEGLRYSPHIQLSWICAHYELFHPHLSFYPLLSALKQTGNTITNNWCTHLGYQ